MKYARKSITAMSVVLMFSGLLIATVFAYPISNVTMSVVDGTDSYFLTTLSGIPSGEDLSDGTYLGWCVETSDELPRSTNYIVTLYSSLNPPASLSSEAWDMVNYILNNKQGERIDIQAAIWYFIKMESPTPGYYTYDPYGDNRYGGNPPSSYTENMVADALANGDGFTPGPCDVLAIICLPDTSDVQTSIIELEIPCEQYEGLTPGFWKNHPVCWMGYSPTDTFEDIFERTITINAHGKKPGNSDPTLMEALNAKGGGINALARHAVAALLNAAHSEINYPLSTDEVKEALQNAIDSGDSTVIEALKNELDMYNNAGGGIDAHGNPI